MNRPSCSIPAGQDRPELAHHRRNNAIEPAYAFVVDSDASAVPIWKLELPDPLARHLTDRLDATDLAGYIERRIEELGLRDDTLSDTSRNAHEYLWTKWNCGAWTASQR